MYRAICGTYVNSSPAGGPSSHPTPGRGEGVPSTPQANALVPAATSAGSHPVQRAARAGSSPRWPLRRAGRAPAGDPGGGPSQDRGAGGQAPAGTGKPPPGTPEAGPTGSRSPRYEPPGPPRRPVLSRPYPAGRRNQGARGEPPPIRWLRSRGPYPEPGGFASRGRRGFYGPERRKAGNGQKGPLPGIPPAVRGERNPLEPRPNPGVTEAEPGGRPDEGQSGPGPTGEPPGANRPRLARGGNGGAGEQVPRAPGPACAPWLARAVTNDADNAAAGQAPAVARCG